MQLKNVTTRIRVLPALLAVAGMVLASATANAGITHRYSFGADVASGGTVEDLVGNADGTLLNGASTTGGLMLLTGGGGQGAAHLSIPANGAAGAALNINTYSALTVEMWANTANTSDWVRYFDFGGHNIDAVGDPGNLAGNSIFATVDAGGANTIRLAISNVDLSGTPSQAGFDNEQRVNASPNLQPPTNVEHHFVAVMNDVTDSMQLYLNGVQLGTVLNSNPAGATSITHTLSLIQEDFALIGAALYPDPGWTGNFNEVRIYDMAASPIDVAHSFVRGPGGTPIIPEPAAAVLLLMGLAGMISVRRRRG